MILHLRKYRPADCRILAELFFDTVHTINIRDYSREQADAWADGNVDLIKWNTSFLSHHTVVAETDGIIVGFGDIDKSGYLDRLYVHAQFQRQGIASALCDELEHSVSVSKIITHASVTARGFFAKRGYTVIKEQQVQRKGVFLTNYIMERQL